MRHMSRKKHWPYVKIGYLPRFMCYIIITSFRKVLTVVIVILAHSLGRSTPAAGGGVEAPLPTIQCNFCKYITKDGENLRSWHFVNCF